MLAVCVVVYLFHLHEKTEAMGRENGIHVDQKFRLCERVDGLHCTPWAGLGRARLLLLSCARASVGYLQTDVEQCLTRGQL